VGQLREDLQNAMEQKMQLEQNDQVMLASTNQELQKLHDELDDAIKNHEKVNSDIEKRINAALADAEDLATSVQTEEQRLQGVEDAKKALHTELDNAKQVHNAAVEGAMQKLENIVTEASMSNIDGIETALSRARESHKNVTSTLADKLDAAHAEAQHLQDVIQKQEVVAKEQAAEKQQLQEKLQNAKVNHTEVLTTLKKSLDIAYEELGVIKSEKESADEHFRRSEAQRDSAQRAIVKLEESHRITVMQHEAMLEAAYKEAEDNLSKYGDEEAKVQEMLKLQAKMEHEISKADKRHAQVVMMLRASLHETMTRANLVEFEREQALERADHVSQQAEKKVEEMKKTAGEYQQQKEDAEHEVEHWRLL